MSKNNRVDLPMSMVFGTLGALLATVVLFIAAIFVEKPTSTVFIVVALALLVLFFVLAYKLGKIVEDEEKKDESKKAHPAGTKLSSTFSPLPPPTDPILNRRYVEGSMWHTVSKDGQKILNRSVLNNGVWVDTPLNHESTLNVGEAWKESLQNEAPKSKTN